MRSVISGALRNYLFLTIMFLAVSVLGCDKLGLPSKKPQNKRSTEPVAMVTGTVIANVNNLPITLEDLDREIAAYNELMEANGAPESKISNRDAKIDYLRNDMVRRALLYQEALDRGMDKKSEVRRILERTKKDLLVAELVRAETENIDVSAKEIEDYYNSSKKIGRSLFYEIVIPEEKQVREIILPSESEARDILIQLLQGADFAALAKERSKAKSASNGGDLGFVAPGSKFAEFDTVVGMLDVGKVSSIFKGPDGYYIIKIEAKRGGAERSLSEMWENLKKEITYIKQQQKLEQLIEALNKNAKIEVYEGVIK
ncbi:MAG: hypothetical protein C4533_08110 [Candidatus Omnitrophota bacterium]|jgi:peptidyl-prolyl cis-trans isomerase C|nr:MAG: hypothetical protein C4533_08110 [Candidatus Omnitrophota bacterium]